jgi:hypothetical protein
MNDEVKISYKLVTKIGFNRTRLPRTQFKLKIP